MADRTAIAARREAIVSLLEAAPLVSASVLAIMTDRRRPDVADDLAALHAVGRVRQVVAQPSDRHPLDAVTPTWVWMLAPAERPSLATELRRRADEARADIDVIDLARALLDAAVDAPSVLEVAP